MKGFLRSGNATSTRNLEKKKKRDGINLQSDSILDQVGTPPGSPLLSLRQISSDSSLTSSFSSSASLIPSPTSRSPAEDSSSPREGAASPFEHLTSASSGSCVVLSSSPSTSSPAFSKRVSYKLKRVTSSPNVIDQLVHHNASSGGGSVSGGSSSHITMLDEDSNVKQRVDQVRTLKANLKKLIAATRRLNTDALRYSKAMTAFAHDGMDKQQLAEKRYTPDSVYAEALAKFAESERSVASHTTAFHQAPSDQFIARITDFVEKDISLELESIKNRYDKARREYDTAVDKVTALRAKSKLDVIKLYNAERDLKRLKKFYEDALEEVHYKLDGIELKKSCSFVEWLMLYCQQERDMYGENVAVVQHLATYLQELRTWTEETKVIFGEGVRSRAEEQAAVVQEERDAIYDPLVNLMQTNPSVVKVVQKTMASEGKHNISIPTPNDRTGIVAFHAFLRECYDAICQDLLVAGRREQLKELASALGLLEKAKEDIEL